MSSEPAPPAITTPNASGEKFSILDPRMLARIRERALRWRIAQKSLSHVVGADSVRNAFACIASTIDLGAGDAIAAQSYRVEAEVARGSQLNRIAAAFSKRKSQRTRTAKVGSASVLALAAGIAGGLSSKRSEVLNVHPLYPAHRPSAPEATATIAKSAVVVALLESQIDGGCTGILRMAAARKLPLVIVALGGAFQPGAEGTSNYELERFPRVPLDRNDPVAIYRVAHEGVERARIGYGPTLVDCLCWPLSQSEDAFASLEQHLGELEPVIARPDIEKQIAAETRFADSSEPEVLLFAPD